jgi:hypothetical protein
VKKKSATYILIIYILAFWLFLEAMQTTGAHAQVGSAVLDLYTQKEPYSGRGLNQSSDAFAPDERVFLYANATYNLSPIEGIVVAFEIKGPPNPINNVVIVATSLTNTSGIATINFTIPWPSENPETVVFGVWNVSSSANIGGRTIVDVLTFKVGWLIEITSLETLSIDLQPQNDFMKGTNLTAVLSIRSISMNPRNVTFVIGITEIDGLLLNTATKTNFQTNSGNSSVYMTLKIPEGAAIGNATIYSSAFTMLPSLGGVSYCPEVTATFEITLLGDLNKDGIVDITDIATAALAFGSYPGHPRWNPNADIDQDRKVDIKDIGIVAQNFGQTDP